MERESVKRIIKQKFSDQEFTAGDLYYSIENNWNKSKFGTLFNTLRNLTREKFLKYELRKRGSPFLKSERQRYGAVFSLNKGSGVR